MTLEKLRDRLRELGKNPYLSSDANGEAFAEAAEEVESEILVQKHVAEHSGGITRRSIEVLLGQLETSDNKVLTVRTWLMSGNALK